LATLLKAVRQVPGAPLTDVRVNRTLDDAEAVVNLGDRAGWKSGTLTVVKREFLLQVKVDATNHSEALKAAKTVARTAMQHLPIDERVRP